MHAFDASSMIYAWDNYPIAQFPGLWDWLAERIAEKRLVMSWVAYDEVKHKTPDCADWIKAHDIVVLAPTNEILQEASRIKRAIGIENDNYHAKGVDENDLLIIAAAAIARSDLVSDEFRQMTLPKEPRKRKIPAVCAMPEVSLACVTFLEYVKESGRVFR